MGKLNLYYHPTLEKIKKAAVEDRLAIAMTYIDDCVLAFVDLSESGAAGTKLLSFFRTGYKNWSKIVYHGLVISVDEDGEEYELSEEVFPEYIYNRITQTVGGVECPNYDFTDFDIKMKGIYKKLGWAFDEWRT